MKPFSESEVGKKYAAANPPDKFPKMDRARLAGGYILSKDEKQIIANPGYTRKSEQDKELACSRIRNLGNPRGYDGSREPEYTHRGSLERRINTRPFGIVWVVAIKGIDLVVQTTTSTVRPKGFQSGGHFL